MACPAQPAGRRGPLRAPSLLLLLLLLALSSVALAQQPTPDPGGNPSGVLDLVALGTAALAAIQVIATLPEPLQREFLKQIGAAAVEQGTTACNVFGGADACLDVQLPAGSPYVTQCPAGASGSVRVDCFYAPSVLASLSGSAAVYDPAKAIREAARAASPSVTPPPDCPGCVADLSAHWCAGAVPACGSFDANVVSALLPALSKVAAAQAAHTDPAVAVARVLPGLMSRVSLARPCRRLCEAVVASCACGQAMTFGQVWGRMAAARPGQAPLPGLPPVPALPAALLSPLMDLPVCQLYADEATPGFTGYCPAAPANASCGAGFCAGDVPTFAQAQMVSQLLSDLEALVRGPQLWQEDAVRKAGRGSKGRGGGGGNSNGGGGGDNNDYGWYAPPPPPGGRGGDDDGGGGGDETDPNYVGPPPSHATVAGRHAATWILGLVLAAAVGTTGYLFYIRRQGATGSQLTLGGGGRAAYQELAAPSPRGF